jgi:transposase
MVLWDSGPYHRSKLVERFLANRPRLEVHRFPGCSPDLNPAEWA